MYGLFLSLFLHYYLYHNLKGSFLTALFLFTLNTQASKVTVYDRNGQRVFEKQNYQNDWDGVYQKNGELLPVGSYYYRIDLGDGTPIFDGWIYLTY